MSSVLAFDIGASSGRALTGTLQNQRLIVEEILRFPNDPVLAGNHLYWDILRLFHDIKQGIVKARHAGCIPVSIALDSWAIDYGLLGRSGELLGNPYHYRDHRTDRIMEEVFQIMPKEEIFRKTGIQFLPFNTIYQLYAAKQANPSLFRESKHFLMIPDLLRYFLTGQIRSEFSNATTTQLYNPALGRWDADLLQRLGIPEHIFSDIVSPASFAGHLRPSVCDELGVPRIPVHAVAEHDTGSAVAAIPAEQEDFLYLICGTWSLMGTEVKEALINDQVLAFNFTNEGGVGQTFRLLKNIMGLWIIQECLREWNKAGKSFGFEELVTIAGQAKPFTSFIDPDDLSFMKPTHMPQQVRQFCRKTDQLVPEDVGSITRCVLESLALKYRYVFERTEQLTGKRFNGLHMVGGGIHNKLLCQFTANAIGRPVWAGPAEASAIGNILVQYIALGQISGIKEARAIVRNSFPLETYYPQNKSDWDEAYIAFLHATRLDENGMERG